MNDDLNAWVRIMRSVDDERKGRIAGVLSVAAIVLLLVTNITIAFLNNAAPQAVFPSSPLMPAEAAPYDVCPKLSKGKWLRVETARAWDGKAYEIYCQYDGDKLMRREEVVL